MWHGSNSKHITLTGIVVRQHNFSSFLFISIVRKRNNLRDFETFGNFNNFVEMLYGDSVLL